MFGTLFPSSDIVASSFGTGMIATLATALLTLLGLSWVSERWRIPLALSGVALFATGLSYLESGTVWLAGHTMSAAYRYTAWFSVQPLQVATLFFYARIAGAVPAGVFWRTTIAAVLMVLSRYLGDAGVFNPTLAVLLSIAFWLYILGEAYFGAESAALHRASRVMRLGYFWIRLIFTIGWAIYPILFFVETVIGAGHTPSVIVLYSIADLINLIVVALIVLTVAGQERY
jgi:sensory rhodopsin